MTTRALRIPLLAAALVGLVSVVVVLMLTARVRHGGEFNSFDWRVLRDFRRHRSPLLVDASRALADLGSIGTLVVVAAAVGLLLRRRGLNPILCAVPLASLLVAGGFVQIMKLAIDRAGPHAYYNFTANTPGSFPSGHSADTTALCVGLAIVLVAALVRRPVERVAVFGLAVAFSVAVGVSRVVLGVHWPTDVMAGWAVGLGTALAVGMLAVLATHDHPFATPRAAHSSS
jgi:undecaprenyl-diphosphatase